jgi:hypothetical protein
MTELKDGTVAWDPRLDRIYQRDLRSLAFLSRDRVAAMSRHIEPRSYTWSIGIFLDQGAEGACVGYGFTHELAARPVAVVGVNGGFARQVYFDGQRIDEWPGGAYPGASPFYEGTSVLAGAKVLQSRGFYLGYDWALSAEDVADGIGYLGPCVLGLNWYDGMFDTDAKGFIHKTGPLLGGHCIVAVGVRIVYKSWISRLLSRRWDNVDLDRSYVTLHNSWGSDWGVNGQARLSLRDLGLLLAEQGDACFPRRNTAKVTA